MKRLGLFALLATLLVCLGEGRAHAQEQFRAETWERPSGSLGLRYGSDNLNLGLGLNGGYTIDPGVYIGGMFNYFFGESEEAFGTEVSFSAWMFMVEGGYDFGVTDNLILRPVLGLGVIGMTGEVCVAGNCVDNGDTGLELGLGGHVVYVIDTITLGGELRILFGDADAFMAGVNVGLLL